VTYVLNVGLTYISGIGEDTNIKFGGQFAFREYYAKIRIRPNGRDLGHITTVLLNFGPRNISKAPM